MSARSRVIMLGTAAGLKEATITTTSSSGSFWGTDEAAGQKA